MRSFAADLRYSARQLARTPGFTVIAILTIAIGIGACTSLFTVINAVLIRPLSYDNPDRIVRLYEVSDDGNEMNVPEANFLSWHEEAKSFDALAMYSNRSATMAGPGGSRRITYSEVSDEFFRVFRVKPWKGRFFFPEEMKRGATPVLLVSHAFWVEHLNRRTDFENIQLDVEGYKLPVVGVLPPGFDYPHVEIWTQAGLAELNPSRSAHNWRVIGRFADGVSLSAANAEIDAIARRIHESYTDVTAVSAHAIPLQDQLTRFVRKPLAILFGAVMMLLLVACANVMGLLIVRSTSRRRESAVRAALGASRWRRAQLFLAESLLIGLSGGILGIVLSVWGVDLLLALSPTTLPRASEIHLDGSVLAFALGVSLVIALALGAFTGLRAGQGDIRVALVEGRNWWSSSSGQNRIRSALVVGQLALTLVLLVGAGLLARSFWQILQVDLGFSTRNRLAITASLPASADDDEAASQRSVEFNRKVLETVSSIPGVVEAGSIDSVPLSHHGGNGRFLIEGRGDSRDYWPGYRVVSPGYFETTGIPLLAGRAFTASDDAESPEVAVISQDVARSVFPGENPIGQRINMGNMDGDETWMTIVGIVGDVRSQGPDEKIGGAVYALYLQRPAGARPLTTVAETTGDPMALAPTIRKAILQFAPDALVEFDTLGDLYDSSLSGRRFGLTLLVAFGATALVLALMGIYGVVAYSVARRIPEVGIRVALGAQKRDIVWLFASEGAMLVLAGLALGVPSALVASRFLASQLFDVQTTDALAYLAAALPLFLAASIACYIPASRGSRIDPMAALRHD